MNCVSICKSGALIIKPGHAIRCIGGTAQLAAFFQYENGEEQVTQGLTWATSDSGIANIDSNGLVTSIGRGEVTISAAWHGYEAFMELAVLSGASCCDQVHTQTVVLLDNSI